jgi:hypothetical protein
VDRVGATSLRGRAPATVPPEAATGIVEKAREEERAAKRTSPNKPLLMVAALRYLDTFVKTEGAWLFAERRLYVDRLEERALS